MSHLLFFSGHSTCAQASVDQSATVHGYVIYNFLEPNGRSNFCYGMFEFKHTQSKNDKASPWFDGRRITLGLAIWHKKFFMLEQMHFYKREIRFLTTTQFLGVSFLEKQEEKENKGR